MNEKLTYIAILLDRSGSMSGSETDVVGGVNTFLDEQRRVPGDAVLTISRFDTEYETIMEDVDLKVARNLQPADFVPRGGTALSDALNRLITHVGAKLWWWTPKRCQASCRASHRKSTRLAPASVIRSLRPERLARPVLSPCSATTSRRAASSSLPSSR